VPLCSQLQPTGVCGTWMQSPLPRSTSKSL
jgi:hypothetical protein